MRVKHLVLLSASALMVAGISYLEKNSGFGYQSRLNSESLEAEMEDEEEGEAERGIQGAIESVYFMRLNEKTHTIEPEWVEAAIAQADKLKLNRRASNLKWENMGPDNIGGRIRAFLLHKDSLNLMFASGVSGGLWRSNTAGQSWYPVNDMQENLNVNCIAQTIDGSIYYGTGEGQFTNLSGTRNGSPAFIGDGVYKSSDNRGTSFKRLNSTTGGAFQRCNAMVAHPTENKLFVATSNGLYVTTNGGTNFTSAKSGTYTDMAIDKNGIVWAANGVGAIFKSDANGAFAGAAMNNSGNGFPPSNGRTSIAVSPQDPETVYAMASNGGRLTGVYRTVNGGQSWEVIINYSTITDVFGSNRQGWYDNVIAVDPGNKNRIYLGGVVLATWDNIDGFREIASLAGVNWNTQYIHADKHIIQFDTRVNPPWMIVGTDGGLFFSQDRTTWTPRNRGLTTLQLYNVAANRLGYIIGGAQDNGTNIINFSGNAQNKQLSRTGLAVYGGDGFDAEFSRIFPGTIFVSSQNGHIARSGNMGQSTSTFWDSRIKPDASAANPPDVDFNTCFTLWEKESDSTSILFVARDAEVWAAINPTDFANPVNWFRIASGLGNDRIVEMDATPDGDHLFIAKDGRVYRVDNIQSANFDVTVYPTITDIPSPISTVLITPAAVAGRTVTSVNVDQANKDHLVVTTGGYGNTNYVFETNNALAVTPTWKNITGDLPDMPVYDAVVDVDNPAHIILGTDLGIYETVNGGTSWIEANEGMARVPVYEIRGYEFHPWEGMALYIGTHGRGYYRSISLMSNSKAVKRDELKTQVYPNPAGSLVNVIFNAVKNSTATVEVFGFDGKLYEKQTLQAQTGNNSVPLNVSKMPNGYYFARISLGNTTSTVKFLVNR